MANNLDDIRQLIKEARKELMNKANVVATGVGYKTSAGKQTSELALICSVDSKKSVQSLTKKELIPASIQNIPTDVNPTGIIRAQQDPTGRFRPAPGGVSIGHYSITAGTLGCLVKKNNKLYILSNNHVLANSNDAAIGDDIIQPGSYDGGQLPDDKIAELSEFVQIQFAGPGVDPCGVGNAVASFMNVFAKMLGSGTRLQSTRIQAEDNLVDCAIAAPINEADVKNEILHIGTITQTAEGTLGMAVKKSGRTTGFTEGTIQQIDVTSQVNYGSNKIATFTDQLLAGAMSQGGDSGSAVVSSDNKLVGLLFAGSDTSTVINRIQNVFQLLQVTLP